MLFLKPLIKKYVKSSYYDIRLTVILIIWYMFYYFVNAGSKMSGKKCVKRVYGMFTVIYCLPFVSIKLK